jgi:threonine dehydrogenase-like Zn-dependent dehydrogenase
VEVHETELAPPQDGEVLVRTSYSGISGGTELLVWRGEVPQDLALDDTLEALGGTFSYPFPYGYSCVGEVDGTGEPVFAFHPHQDLLVVRPETLVRLPEAVPPRLATLFPLVETALQVTLDAGPRLEEPVVVLGLGVLGTLTGLLLARAGARVVAAEPRAWRRELADSLGLRAVAPEELAGVVGAETGGRGVAVAVDASGNPDVPGRALELLAHEGTLLVASWLGTKLSTLPLGREFHRRRLVIRSTQVSTIPAHLTPAWTPERRRQAAAELLTRLPLAVLATHEFPLERAGDAFAALDGAAEERLLHVALSYRE